jgi:phospholipid-binding lipoprotein MlaA
VKNSLCKDSYDYADEYEYENTVIIKDPFERFNRKMLSFDIFVLENIAEPIMNGYKAVTNQFIRDRISNFGDRFNDPLILINSLLQFDFKNASKTIITFGVNMTVGFFGLFNPSKIVGLYRENKTLGGTLGFYGLDNGFYLVLPFLGPTTLRNSIGQLAGLYIDPFNFNGLSIIKNKSLTPNHLIILKFVGQYAENANYYINLNKKFLQKSFDPYIFMRESYIQNIIYNEKKEKK